MHCKSISLFFFGIILVFFSSCRGRPNDHFFRVNLGSEPATIDITKATGRRESQMIRSVYEGLTRYHPQTLEPLPGVAERWTLSPDKKTYTFYLRNNALWSDGTPVTADDFWRSWEHLLNPATEAKYAGLLLPVRNAEAYHKGKLADSRQLGFKVLDPLTFQVTLERPTPYFLSITSFSPLILPKEGAKVYNGPFVLSSWDAKQIILLRNPHYWGKEEVRIKGVQCFFSNNYKNFSVALQRYDTYGIDILNDPPPELIPILKWRQDFKDFHVLRTDYFLLNLQQPALQDGRLRRAMAMAIDRQRITEKILQRGDIPYGSFVPPQMPDYHADQYGQSFDPDRAKELLREAGYGPLKPLPVVEVHSSDLSDTLLVMKEIRGMWQQNIGLETTLRTEAWVDFQKSRSSRNFQVSWGGWYGDFLDPTTFLELFSSDHAQNYSGWKDARYDSLLAKAREEPDRVKRSQYLERAEKILLEDGPIIPVLNRSAAALVRPYVKGYYNNPLDIHPYRDIYLSD